MSTHQFQPDLPPPANTVGPVGWLRKIYLMDQLTVSSL